MNRNRQTEILGGIFTAVILILLIFLSNVEVNKLSYIESVASSIINPIQRVVTDAKNKIQKNTAYFSNMDNIMAENEELKKKNSELEAELRELEIIKAENTTLKEYRNLAEKYSMYETIPAYVINKDVSNYSSTLVLNVGADDGIQENMTVIADKGLVGHVISVAKKHVKYK